MSETTTSATDLTSQYAAQVTDDLERNVKEQDRVGADITALQQQLAGLQHDHVVLVNMQQALGLTPPQVAPQVAEDRATVPAARRKPAAKSGTDKQTKPKKTTPARGRGAAVKTAAKKPAKKAVAQPAEAKAAEAKPAEATAAEAKASEPTLVELVRRHLSEQNEPRSAAEIATGLGQVHPERAIKTTVIRTTLEGLVAKNQAQRSKQGASVFYSTPEKAADKAEEKAAPADDTAAAERTE
ncbi:hypothetical protein [Streptomyces gibsoniae]|uniref:Regulatory protein n=1 Tax=Streptomyces gibsoniae TaxID=3075529 RepID=A0ABU2U0F1_9ACTN|nr:hypothetical protein [Streptomyces sp. DSM 41699]MDT0466560.1 hypothetical protein [Streptomyces sp. DSM 41699]